MEWKIMEILMYDVYEYQKDTAWFKLYMKKEKEEILEERLEAKIK